MDFVLKRFKKNAVRGQTSSDMPPSWRLLFSASVLFLLSLRSSSTSAASASDDLVTAYVDYLSRHGKDPTRALDVARVATFAAAVAYVQSHRGSFSVKLNEMADWLPDELQVRFSARPAPTAPTSAVHLQSAPAPPSGPEPVSIDWATSNNPTGKGTIAAVRNQGLCGACWAFVAAASIESLARIAGGKPLPLSVQELIDCDTNYDKGCDGGNPQYAFEYAKLNALTAWDDYPYREMEAPCRRRHFKPRAAIEGYQKLPEHDQATLRRYVAQGPVAVGICATDRNFMFYAGGVFDAPDCCTTQNHAVLIVGYGHDASAGLDYWVALNSWGLMWGERGHIRLRRTNDTAGFSQCGLAVSAVAPRGGYVLDGQDLEPTKAPSHSGVDAAGGGSGAHGLPLGAALLSFLRDYWAQLALSAAGALMGASLVLLAYVSYVDYVGAPTGDHDEDQAAPEGAGAGADTVAAHSTVLYERLYLLCTQHPVYDQPQPPSDSAAADATETGGRSVDVPPPPPPLSWTCCATGVGAAWERVRAVRRECWLWLFRACLSAHGELSEAFQTANGALAGAAARLAARRGLPADVAASVQQLVREVLACFCGPQRAYAAPSTEEPPPPPPPPLSPPRRQ